MRRTNYSHTYTHSCVRMASMQSMLLPPTVLEIHDTQAAEKWKLFKRAWNNYSLATGLSKKTEPVQVTTLLTVIGEEAREVFSTFSNWEHEGDNAKIEPVLAKFEQYCQPRKNVPFERYRFNKRTQEPGESYDQYRTALRKIAEGCEFDTIIPDEILQDRLVFGIKDSKTRERLLRTSELTLKKTDEICHAAESMSAQMRVVEESSTSPTVSAIERDRSKPKLVENGSEPRRSRECWNCGRRHDIQKRELCPAYGKRCSKCRRLNHFAAKCRSGGSPSVRLVMSTEDQGESEQIFHTHTSTASLDDSQTVTLRLDSGSHIRFQVDTGAQCNVVPLGVYKKATSDTALAQVCPSRMTITGYGGTTLPVVGTVLLCVWRGKYHCLLDCKLVDRSDIRPLLTKSMHRHEDSVLPG